MKTTQTTKIDIKPLSIKMHLIHIITEIFDVLVVVKMFYSNLLNHFRSVIRGRGRTMPNKKNPSNVLA